MDDGLNIPKFGRLLRKLTQKARHKQHHHAVVVLKGGAIKATGFNHGWIHAEKHALEKLWESERKGTKIWSIRISKGGKLSMAKPCVNCEQYLRDNGVKTVFYSNNSGDIECMKL